MTTFTDLPHRVCVAANNSGLARRARSIDHDLSAEETVFRIAFESTPNAILIVDSDGQITMLNSAAERMFGYERQELVGRHLEPLIPERFRARHPEYRNRYFRDPQTRPMGSGRELFARRKDGSEFPVEIGLSPLQIGEQVLALVAIADIEPRLSAQRQMQQSVFETAPNGMVSVTSTGAIALVNVAIEQMFGYARSELIGQPIEILVPVRYRTNHPGHVQQFLADPRMRPTGSRRELVGLRKDGTEIPVEVGLSYFPSDEGKFAIASVVDISNRKRSEYALLENRLRLNAALAAGGIGNWVWELERDRILWDDSTTKLFGHSAIDTNKGAIEQFSVFVHEDDRQRVRESLEECVRSGADCRVEYRLVRPDRTILWVAARGQMDCDAQGKPWRMIGACVDISEQKRAEADRIKYAAELELKNTELQRFVYLASHDLREPLRMVSNYSQLLMDEYRDKIDGDGHKYLQYAHDGAQRMSQLIDGLLQYSRAGSAEEALQRVPLDQIVAQVLMDMHQAIGDSNGQVVVDELPVVLGSPVRLRQVFQNLIANAVKFCADRPPIIRISCRAAEQGYELAVSDNGIGIDSKYFDRIFEIFQRLHSRNEYPGSGIGLSICKRIIEQHGGRIWVESTPTQGSAFHFTLQAASE